MFLTPEKYPLVLLKEYNTVHPILARLIDENANSILVYMVNTWLPLTNHNSPVIHDCNEIRYVEYRLKKETTELAKIEKIEDIKQALTCFERNEQEAVNILSGVIEPKMSWERRPYKTLMIEYLIERMQAGQILEIQSLLNHVDLFDLILCDSGTSKHSLLRKFKVKLLRTALPELKEPIKKLDEASVQYLIEAFPVMPETIHVLIEIGLPLTDLQLGYLNKISKIPFHALIARQAQ